MYEPGSPSSPLTTTTFGPPGARRAKSHFAPVGKPAPPRPRRFAAFTASSQLLRRARRARARSPEKSPGRSSTGSSSVLPHLGLRRRARLAGEHARDRAGAGVDDVAVADGGARVAEPEAHRLAERDARRRPTAPPSPTPSPRSSSRDVRVELGRPARRAGADADVPRAARLASGRRRRSRRRGPNASGRPVAPATRRRSSSVTAPCSSTASASRSSGVGTRRRAAHEQLGQVARHAGTVRPARSRYVVTAWISTNTGAGREQARNGNGTIRDATWFGG